MFKNGLILNSHPLYICTIWKVVGTSPFIKMLKQISSKQKYVHTLYSANLKSLI